MQVGMNRSLGFQGIALLDVSRATKTNYYTAADNIHKAGKEISELIDEKLSPNEQSAEKTSCNSGFERSGKILFGFCSV